MAKTIKFNLICDDTPIRTLEDLRDNFSIEDILGYYKNGLLLRWLTVRGYEEEYNAVSCIDEIDSIKVAERLIQIFDVETDMKKIEESVYILKFLNERKELDELYNKQEFRKKEILDDYWNGYYELVDNILKNPIDMAVIKANITELVNIYKAVLEIDYRNLFNKLRDGSKLATMCLLMNEGTRNYYLPVDSEGNIIDESSLSQDEKNDRKEIYSWLCNFISTSSTLKTALGDSLISFAGITDGYWKDLREKGKRYMIISMGSGDFVRSAGKSGGDLGNSDITNKFIIVDGIDYKSNSATRELLYMEV